MQSAYFTQRHQKVIRRTLTVTPSFEVILWRRTHRGVAALWDAPFTAQPICAVSRLNDLTTPPRLRNGWVVNPDTDPVELGNEISIVCLNGGLAFFERFAAIPPLIDHWKAKRRVKDLFDFDEFQLAAALWLQGDRAEAIRGLEFLVEWRSYSASESPTDAHYFRLDTEVLQWFKSLD